MAESREIRQQELARLLLQKARQDLALVQNVGDNETIADEIVGFHVQQTVEKAIKAVLTRLGTQYEYTHDLSLLYQQVEDAGADPPTTLDALEELVPFAVQFRYTLYMSLDFDRQAGARLAREFIEWAHAVIEAPVRLEDEEDE
jgi:HEPN domain-containing protein